MDTTLAALDAQASWQFLRSARDEDIPLLWAALQIARDEYPALDPVAYEAVATAHSQALRARIGNSTDSLDALRALHGLLFEEQGFSGNDQDYYDPRNSYLNEVIERRTGIPITLCTVFMEVARRAGLEVEGVGLPGHFVVRVHTPSRPLLVDPFHGGTLLSEKDCQDRLDRIFNGKVQLEPKMLRPCRRKEMLERILRNLKAIYLRDQDKDRALRVVDLLIRLQPGSADDLRDRGTLYAALDCYGLAARDLESYLALAPGAKDAEELRARAASLRQQAARLN